MYIYLERKAAMSFKSSFLVKYYIFHVIKVFNIRVGVILNSGEKRHRDRERARKRERETERDRDRES